MTKDVNLRKAIGRRVRIHRKALKISTDTLAEACGISPEHIRKIECGDRAPSMEVLVNICRCLEIPSDYFLQDVVTFPGKDAEMLWEVEAATERQKGILKRLVAVAMELSEEDWNKG